MSVFMNNKCAIYIFQILFSNIVILAYFDPKLPFLSFKFFLNYISIQNMDEITLTPAGWA